MLCEKCKVICDLIPHEVSVLLCVLHIICIRDECCDYSLSLTVGLCSCMFNCFLLHYYIRCLFWFIYFQFCLFISVRLACS